MLDRTGVLHLREHWTLWPIILGGIGLARFLQSVPGEPKQGLLFLTAAAWLFLAETGLVSLADSWPIAIIGFGIIVALNGGSRRRRWHTPRRLGYRGSRRISEGYAGLTIRCHHSPCSVSGSLWWSVCRCPASDRSATTTVSDRVRVVSVMGRSEHTSRATAFQGAEVTNVMGRSELDLRKATLAPGASAAVHVFSAMGAVVVRVPPTWTVDTGAVSALGEVRDERATLPEAEATAAPAPRLVLRGLVMFGRLTITS